MNNNFFSLMRYLRDTGLDAELLMFADESEHFLPENDTWEINKWSQYIRKTNLRNSEIGFFDTSVDEILKELFGYDFYIGCGISPAYLYKAGIGLDIMIPYAYGIEFFGAHKFNIFHPVRELIFQAAKLYQKKGIRKNCKLCITTDYSSKQKSSLDILGIKTITSGIPMIYFNESPWLEGLNEKLKDIISFFKSRDFVLFSHVSHKWKKIPKEWLVDFKRNHILIEGFAEYIKYKKSNNPLLVLFEYGYDVNNSKMLIKDLEIEEYVLWLPQMSRKEIMVLLDYADIGGGELGGALWGGTGWEFISKGIPFFQYVKLTSEEYKVMTGLPMPKFLNVSTTSEIKENLINYENDKAYFKEMGIELKEWFNTYDGYTLAKKYKDIIQNLYSGI